MVAGVLLSGMAQLRSLSGHVCSQNLCCRKQQDKVRNEAAQVWDCLEGASQTSKGCGPVSYTARNVKAGIYIMEAGGFRAFKGTPKKPTSL